MLSSLSVYRHFSGYKLCCLYTVCVYRLKEDSLKTGEENKLYFSQIVNDELENNKSLVSYSSSYIKIVAVDENDISLSPDGPLRFPTPASSPTIKVRFPAFTLLMLAVIIHKKRKYRNADFILSLL